MKGIVIAGTSSGIGKTTIALALMNSLNNVQPYKVGPDYIDPSHHEKITGKKSRNLDIHLMGKEGIKRNYSLGNGDYGVIEGVMGLYDSYKESTAKIAETLDLPVILVIDASNGMESVAATALGFKEFGEAKIKGVIINNVSSSKQEKGIKKGLKKAKIPCLGSVYRSKELEIPSRHLGLYMGNENQLNPAELEKVTENLKIAEIKNKFEEPDLKNKKITKKNRNKKDVKIGLAYDSAFNFYYTYNIEVLRKNSELICFSPLEDELPQADAYYFGGGYPELHLEALENNTKIKKQILHQASTGKPIFAECGGFMYLAETIEKNNKKHKMTGVLPLDIEMTDSLQAVGYTEVEAKTNLPIAEAGKTIKGHEFHYSKAYPQKDSKEAFKIKKGKGINGEYDGLIEYNSLGCYNHFHECSFNYLHKLIKNAQEHT